MGCRGCGEDGGIAGGGSEEVRGVRTYVMLKVWGWFAKASLILWFDWMLLNVCTELIKFLIKFQNADVE